MKIVVGLFSFFMFATLLRAQVYTEEEINAEEMLEEKKFQENYEEEMKDLSGTESKIEEIPEAYYVEYYQ